MKRRVKKAKGTFCFRHNNTIIDTILALVICLLGFTSLWLCDRFGFFKSGICLTPDQIKTMCTVQISLCSAIIALTITSYTFSHKTLLDISSKETTKKRIIEKLSLRQWKYVVGITISGVLSILLCISTISIISENFKKIDNITKQPLPLERPEEIIQVPFLFTIALTIIIVLVVLCFFTRDITSPDRAIRRFAYKEKGDLETKRINDAIKEILSNKSKKFDETKKLINTKQMTKKQKLKELRQHKKRINNDSKSRKILSRDYSNVDPYQFFFVLCCMEKIINRAKDNYDSSDEALTGRNPLKNIIDAKKLPQNTNAERIMEIYNDLISYRNACIISDDKLVLQLFYNDLNTINKILLSNCFSSENLSGIDISNFVLANAKFESTFLSNSKLRNVDFSNAKLKNAYLDNCDLIGAIFKGDQISLSGVNFNKSKLQELKLNNVKTADKANFFAANMTKAVLENVTFDESSFKETILEDVEFTDTSLVHTNFIDSTAVNIIFNFPNAGFLKSEQTETRDMYGAKCDSANLMGAKISINGIGDDDSVNALLKLSIPDDKFIDFRDTSLVKTNFYDSTIFNVNFDRSNCFKANFKRSIIRNSSFCYSTMQNTDFSFSYILGSNYYSSNCINILCMHTVIEKATFSNCIFTSAQFLNTKFFNVDFSLSNFEYTIFSGALLRIEHVNFSNCYFVKSEFSPFPSTNGSTLIFKDVSFLKATVKSSNFHNVDFQGDINFERAKFIGCDFEGCSFEGATIKNHFSDVSDTNFYGVKGLEDNFCKLFNKETKIKNAIFRGTGLAKQNFLGIGFKKSDVDEAFFN